MILRQAAADVGSDVGILDAGRRDSSLKKVLVENCMSGRDVRRERVFSTNYV